MATDKADLTYWDGAWAGDQVPAAATSQGRGLTNLFGRRMHGLFGSVFSGRDVQDKELLELGCGSSVWLPYLGREFGFRVSGLDYSENGCEKARAILAKSGVPGKIIKGDFFDPPYDLLGKFDFVYSSGVAEHFEPTEDCIRAFAGFLKPGAVMLTFVPNMTSIVGMLQRYTDRKVFDIHVPLSKEGLADAHRKAGLTVHRSEYFLSTGFGVVNANALDQTKTSTKLKRSALRCLELLSIGIWSFENLTWELPRSRAFSPYVVCIASKPE